MNPQNVVSIEARLAERIRQSRPALAQDVLDLASGLAELVHAVRALAERVAEIENEWPEAARRRRLATSAGSGEGREA